MFPIEKTSGGCPLFLDKPLIPATLCCSWHLLHSFPVTITPCPCWCTACPAHNKDHPFRCGDMRPSAWWLRILRHFCKWRWWVRLPGRRRAISFCPLASWTAGWDLKVRCCLLNDAVSVRLWWSEKHAWNLWHFRISRNRLSVHIWIQMSLNRKRSNAMFDDAKGWGYSSASEWSIFKDLSSNKEKHAMMVMAMVWTCMKHCKHLQTNDT